MPSKPTVLITGCSDGGIGSGLALEFQKRGYHVFATARNVSKMPKLKDLPDVTLLQLDIVDQPQIKAAAEAVAEKTGGTLDFLISNAGQGRFMPILDEDISAMKDLFEVNVFGPMVLLKEFVPMLIKSKGVVAIITSLAGYLNIPYMGTYAATKRAIEILAETCRLEVAPFGVNVMEIVTGAVQSNALSYYEDWKLPPNSLYKPIESTIAARAQGNDGIPRMALAEYSSAVADEIIKRTPGKFFYGQNADLVKESTTSDVPQSALDAIVIGGTGLDTLSKSE